MGAVVPLAEGDLGQPEDGRTALDRALQELQREKWRAHAHARLASAVATGVGVDGLSAELLGVFCEVLRAGAGALCVPEGDHLRACAAHGVARDALQDRAIALPAHCAAGASSGAPSLQRATFETTAHEALFEGDVANVWAMPLHAGGRLLGVAYFAGLAGTEPTPDEAALLEALAPNAANALLERTSVAELERAVASRDDVLSVVAHDLQNPINVISIAANMLMQRSPDSSTRRSLERIIRGAQRAARMIRDLQEVNAIETGRFSIQRRRLEPADLLLAALESQQSLAADASVILASDISPELPLIEADEERLLEVLENLIGNAVKFTNAGGSITVGATHRERVIEVWVKDSGSGIAPEELPHIFDRFWQAKKSVRRGTGLGLTICRAIVQAHGGEIRAESIVGVGTTVYFTVPIASVPNVTAEPAVANILLVDDRPENLVALSAILERPDYRLVTATSGEEALRLALREHFAVALIDIAMPGMSGLEVAVHLKDLERSRDIPIIFITAFGDDPEEIHRAYSAGGADYLVKPLDVEIVRKKVAVFVDLSRKRQKSERAG